MTPTSGVKASGSNLSFLGSIPSGTRVPYAPPHILHSFEPLRSVHRANLQCCRAVGEGVAIDYDIMRIFLYLIRGRSA